MPVRKDAVGTQRLFFALWPEMELQEQVAQAARALLPSDAGRRVRTDNLHCTLVFLGNVDTDRRACVEAAADQVRGRLFSLHLDRFGYFRRPQIAWLGCSTIPPELGQLVTDLGSGCDACGFPSEHRPYEVHITLARKVRSDPGRPMMMAIDWMVDRFALVESVNTEEGVRYQPLRFWVLGDK